MPEYITELCIAELNALLLKTAFTCAASIDKNIENNGAMTARQKKQPNKNCNQFNLFFKPSPPFIDLFVLYPNLQCLLTVFTMLPHQDALIRNQPLLGDYGLQNVLHIHLLDTESGFPACQSDELFLFP